MALLSDWTDLPFDYVCLSSLQKGFADNRCTREGGSLGFHRAWSLVVKCMQCGCAGICQIPSIQRRQVRLLLAQAV